MTVLDGARLAERRAPIIAQRAADVRSRRGRPPTLALLAFRDAGGSVPHIGAKIRRAAAVGVDITPVIIEPGRSTDAAIEAMLEAASSQAADAVFVQFPYPDSIDGEALAAAIPTALDIDIMTPVRIAHFMNGRATLPPVTVTAGLLLLDAYDVSVSDRSGVVIADENPFALMFRGALERRGARMDPLVDPATPDLAERVHAADLVIAAAGMPGIVDAAVISRGAVAIDVGYFNPGGRGDIDLSGGVDHLRAISPVPGGIGPMTISALLERVVEFAERHPAGDA